MKEPHYFEVTLDKNTLLNALVTATKSKTGIVNFHGWAIAKRLELRGKTARAA